MRSIGLLATGVTVAQEQAPAAAEMPLLRVVVRVAIGVLIAVLLTYIVIEQVGSWRRRRSDRD